MFGWIKNAFGKSSNVHVVKLYGTPTPKRYSAYDAAWQMNAAFDPAPPIPSPIYDHQQYIGAGSPGFICDDAIMSGRGNVSRFPRLQMRASIKAMLEFNDANAFDLYPADLADHTGDCNMACVPGLPHILGITHLGGMSVVDLMKRNWTDAQKLSIIDSMSGYSFRGTMSMVAETIVRTNANFNAFKNVVPRPEGVTEKEYDDYVWTVGFSQTSWAVYEEANAYVPRTESTPWQPPAPEVVQVQYSQPTIVDKVAKFAYENPMIAGMAFDMLFNDKHSRK